MQKIPKEESPQQEIPQGEIAQHQVGQAEVGQKEIAQEEGPGACSTDGGVPGPGRPPSRILGVLQTLAVAGGFAAAGPLVGPWLRPPPAPLPGFAPSVEPSPVPNPRRRPRPAPPRAAGPAGPIAPEPLRPGVPGYPPGSGGPMGELWLVDGFNVIQVAALAGRGAEEREGWWQEPARRALLERSGSLAEPDAEVWVVFDGPRPASAPAVAGCARGVFAPSADAWVLERLREAPDPGRVRVVTADRRLADRARSRGAAVVAPRDFLERCPGPPSADP